MGILEEQIRVAGHKDNKNVSGLGYYHYHCDGNPPHLHTNGICPYDTAIPTVTNTYTPTVKSIDVESVTIDTSIKDIEAGETLKLTTTILPSNSSNKTIKWTSSNTSVLDIDSTGLIIAKNSGIATVTASSINGIIDKKEITVKQSPKSIVINNPITEITVGETIQLNIDVEPSNSVYETIWTTSDSQIATVDSKGNVKALKEGNVTITVKTNNLKENSVNITIKPGITDFDALQNTNETENTSDISGALLMISVCGLMYFGYKKFKYKKVNKQN